MRKPIRNIVLLLLCLTLIASCFAVVSAKQGKGKGSGAKVKISAEIEEFPLPYMAVRVSARQQKAPRGWYEYRAVLSWENLLGFYQINMPGHGWKLVSVQGPVRTWRHGNRFIQVRYVRVLLIVCLIQVRVLRG
jgi:hypothetical protein